MLKQRLITFKLFDDFSVNFSVLQSPVQNNEHLGVNRPVIQMFAMPVENELDSTKRAYTILMFPVHALK